MADALPLHSVPESSRAIPITDCIRLFYFSARREKPLVLVLEDVHWADGATLDLIKYLARRVRVTQALLILTYRDDELNLDHPLRRCSANCRLIPRIA